MREFDDCLGFQWDEGNAEKSWSRRRVSRSECEEAFFNRPFVVREDRLHTEEENRFLALGQTDGRRLLLIVVTIRTDQIRVISARDMTPRERRAYQHAKEKDLEADPGV